MLKKIICMVSVICIFASLNVSAENNFTIKPDGKFEEYSISQDNSRVEETIGISESEFSSFCKENDVIYFAVNSNNTKQIKITCNKSDFSNSINNLSELSDDKINALMSNITGSDSIKGEIVTKNSQKFIKTKVSSEDSGGNYTVVQYITVAGKLNYNLSFLTSSGQDTDYIEKTFKTYNTKDFNDSDKSGSGIRNIILLGLILFSVASVFILYTLVRDLKQRKRVKKITDIDNTI